MNRKVDVVDFAWATIVIVLLIVIALFLTGATVVNPVQAIRLHEYIVLYDRTNGCYVNYTHSTPHWVVIDQWGVTEYSSNNLGHAIQFLVHDCQP